MNYYSLKLSYDPKVIGVRNGIYQVELFEKMYGKDSLSKLNDFFVFRNLLPDNVMPDFDVEFYFKKLKSTKETSFLSYSPYLNHCHFLINESTVDVFKHHNIQRVKYYDAKIFDSNGEDHHDHYKMFFSILLDWDVIDFERTVFVWGGYGNVPITEQIFRDSDDFYSFGEISRVKKLALNRNFDSSLDLFHTCVGGIFVSERLKLALEENNATGITFNDKVEVLI